MSRLFLAIIWILLGFFTVRTVIRNISEIQKDLDSPNPLIKSFGIENNM